MSQFNPHPGGADAFAKAEQGIGQYLNELEASGRLSGEYLSDARKNVPEYLKTWITSSDVARLSPNLQQGLVDAIENERWNELVNAFARKAKFGTGGIRALMAFDRDSIVLMKEIGIDAPIIKGENTINNLVLLRAAYGIANWFTEQGREDGVTPRAVVGCDSRIQGHAFAKAIAEVLLAEGMEVYLFDEPVPYPGVTFALPTVKGDVGIFISASHNDYRYNGFKMSGANGAQISMETRDQIALRIGNASFADIKTTPLEELAANSDPALKRLHYLGGASPLPGVEYYGCEIVPIHQGYSDQMKRFVVNKDLIGNGSIAEQMKVIFAAFNGAGRTTVPLLLSDLGFKQLYPINSLFNIDGLFPAFKSDPGEEQQPDPGDPRAATIALNELAKEKGKIDGYIDWQDADLLVGTDPDADRCGVIAHPPESLAKYITEEHYPRYSKDHVLIPADDMWSLLIWHRLANGEDCASDLDKKFIALSHTTSDSIVFLAKKFGLGVLKTWVGFAWLSTGVRAAWAGQLPLGIKEGYSADGGEETCNLIYYDTTGMDGNRTINVATLEQSNGFSILGAPPADQRSMGVGGHVMDKDGTLAALLTAELACYAKVNKTDLMSLMVKHLYSDPDIGLFANYYEPDPLDGEYPGLEGDTKKRGILDKAEEMYRQVDGDELVLGGRRVTSARKYWTGKYDSVNGAGFPDEGLRFYFGDEINHVTVRPSGTTNSLRFHVQLYGGVVSDAETAWKLRLSLEAEAKGIVDQIRDILGAQRAEGSIY